MICPNTSHYIPHSATQVRVGKTTFILCPHCDTGDGGMQPHPLAGCLPDAEEIGREGDVIYVRFNKDVRFSYAGRAWHHYCWHGLWDQSTAYRRIHGSNPTRRAYTAKELQDMTGESNRGPDAARRRQSEKRRRVQG